MKINERKAGVLLSYGYTGANAVMGLIYVPLIIYFLGQEEYGLYQIMGSLLVYLSLFDFGLSNTVTRYYSKYLALKDEKGAQNLLAISSIIYVVLTIILLLVGSGLYFFIDELFGKTLTSSELVTAEKMYIIVLINVAITVSTAVFNSAITAHEKFVFFKGLQIVQTIFRPIIVYGVFMLESSALILVIVETVINIAGVLIKIYYSYKNLNVKIKLLYWDQPLFKEMINFSFLVFLTAIMDQIFWRSDQIILGAVSGTNVVAIFSIASQIVNYYMTLSTAMSGVFLPNITKRVMTNASNEELTDIFVKVGRLQFTLLGAILIGFILYGKEFIILWVGDNFIVSYYIALIIMVPFTIDLIQNIGLTILQAKNMYSFRAFVFLGMAIIKVGISIPLANYYGGIGASIATGISYLVGNGLIMNVYYLKKVNLNIFKFWNEIIKLGIPISLTFLIGLGFKLISIGTPLLTLLARLLLFVIIYVLIIWKYGMNNYERQLFKGPIQVLRRSK